ncbi:HSA domain-containing protein [Phytophthora infestans]|uniref:HSA domain-containing protein n=1 Tax=Phytophthora infestans TaxID=4787 RepID=A0A833S8T1_PHYIN|nr:HSA domain-containing protein [Phytophthora infestans]
MANARLKQARRRASSRTPNAAQPVVHPSAQTPAASSLAQGASTRQDEQIADAQSEQVALQSALLERKSVLEGEIQDLTLGKTMHKEPEPGCDPSGRHVARYHRDYLLQEMEWMAADFSQERKWRLRNAKMLSQALVSHLDRQEQRLARQKKSEEIARRRTAARVGRDVKKFWTKIDKIIAFKVKLQADELRQKHMQKHLVQLVEQTEKYATALAASFQEAEEADDEEKAMESEDSDADFEMVDEEEDDETTIEAEESRSGPLSKRQAAVEVATLQEEAEMSIEELRARYAAVEEMDEAGDSSEDGEFELTEEEDDDETTIAAEEQRNGPVSRRQAAAEMAELQEENELSIEELRARYAEALQADGETVAEQDEIMEVENTDDVGDRDFVPTRRDEEEQADDETTMEEEERLEEVSRRRRRQKS